MAQKGQRTKTNALDYKDYLKLIAGLRKDKLYKWELYCIVSFATGMRISDTLSTCWRDILNKEIFNKAEKKTGNFRSVFINEEIRKHIADLYHFLGSPDISQPLILNEQSGKAYSRVHVNRLLKIFQFRYKLPPIRFASHSLRKTLGRYTYDKMGRTAESIVLLSDIYGHKNPGTTWTYIGLRDDEIKKVFEGISLKP